MDGGTASVSTIASYVRTCLAKLKLASASYEEANAEIKEKLLNGSISDQAGRFRLWSSNIGGHQLGRSSLDYRLREASHISNQILDLLREYLEVLDETVDITTENRRPWEDSLDMQSECLGDETFLQSTTELEQLVSNMADINTSLMHLSVAIRNPAPHDQFKGSKLIDLSHFEDRDVGHVCSKFKLAQEFLQQRLGKGISRRRQYLQYRKNHRSKLEYGIAQIQPDMHEYRATDDTTVPLSKGQSTVASSIPLDRKAWSSADIDVTAYEDTLSQTSYASSTQDASKLHPPPLPVAGRDGDPFECQLCYRFSSVKNTAAWRKHLYRDLQPYLCTFEDCRIADQMYESRNDWFDHELAEHRQWWECIENCNLRFGSEEAFRLHLVSHHPQIGNGEQVVEFMEVRRRLPRMDTEADCALCGARLMSLIQLRRHLGSHLQELSLSAIPLEMLRADTDTEDNSIVDGESRSLSSGAFEDEVLPTEFVCDVCQKTFSGEEDERLEALRIHMSETHLDADPADPVIDPPTQVKEETQLLDPQQDATQTREETRDIHEQAQPAQSTQSVPHQRETETQEEEQSIGELAQPDQSAQPVNTTPQSITGMSEWVWSPDHDDFYRFSYDQDGNVLYEWAKNRSESWSGTTTSADTTAAPADSVPDEERHRVPNFIAGTPSQGWYERLDSSYRMRTGAEARNFFKIGRVFSMLYIEAAGATARFQPEDDAFTEVRFGERAYTQIRRFVVVSVRRNFVQACAISTYRNQGTFRRGCDPTEHALVYNSGIDPESCYLPGERERGLTKEPIEVIAADASAYLIRASRIRFGKIYSIEWNVKVKDIGFVTDDCLGTLMEHYKYEDQRWDTAD